MLLLYVIIAIMFIVGIVFAAIELRFFFSMIGLWIKDSSVIKRLRKRCGDGFEN